jgi:hypothetical protein
MQDAENAQVLFALSRLYTARLDLLQLESLRDQQVLLFGRLRTKSPISILNRFPPRGIAAASAVLCGVVSLQFFLLPESANYWRGSAFGVLGIFVGAFAWALYAHDRRVRLLSERLIGELEMARHIRSLIDETVADLEDATAPKARATRRSSVTARNVAG